MKSFAVLIALAGSAAAGTVTGQVVENGFRVAEFAVRIDRGPAFEVADGDGRFTIDDVDDGPHRLTLIGWAFRTEHVDIAVHGKTDLGKLVVEEGRRVVGHVVDQNDQPVPNATVLAYENPPNAIGTSLELLVQDVHNTTTSEDGSFAIYGLPQGDVVLRVEAVDGERRSIEQLIEPGVGTPIDLVVARVGNVVGNVANHRRLVSPVVRATPVGAVGKPFIAGINPRGHFELELPAGVYDLTLDDEHQAPLQVVVVEKRTRKVELAAPTSHADLVVSSSGCSVATLLGARPHEHDARTEIEAEICEDDHVRFSGLAPGAYRVCIDDECQPVTVRASPRVQTLKIVVPESRSESESLESPF
jgi:hypothetical protein